MEDPKLLIKSLSNEFEGNELKKTIETFIKQQKESIESSHIILNELNDQIYELERNNNKIEDEIAGLQLTQSRNNEAYNKKNNERYKLASKMIAIEQANEELENEMEGLRMQLKKKEEDMKSISYPSAELLYYEIVRGFGVKFINNNGKDVIRIKNKNKNDIFEITSDNKTCEQICEEIWELID